MLLLSPFIGIVLLELGLRVAHDLCGGWYGWLYMSGAQTSYGKIETLPELIAASGQPIDPFAMSNDFILNSRGLRTIEYADQKPPHSTRIVVLGDSHTWASGGMPFLDLWHSRVHTALAERVKDRSVELVSLAIPAVGPEFELRMWEIEGQRLSPDVVILALSVGNDFLEVDADLADQSALDRWARRSYVVRLFRNMSRLRRLGGSPAANPGAADPAPELATPSTASAPVGGIVRPHAHAVYDRTAPKYSVAAHHEIIAARLVISDRRPGPTAQFERASDRIATILHALNDSVKEHGARLVVLLIPDEHQLDDALLDALAKEQNTTRDNYDIERPQRRLRAMCAQEGVICVDPLDALRERARVEPMFNVRETHMNDLGHAVLAEFVLRALAENHLVE